MIIISSIIITIVDAVVIQTVVHYYCYYAIYFNSYIIIRSFFLGNASFEGHHHALGCNFICDRPRENQQKGDDTGTLF